MIIHKCYQEAKHWLELDQTFRVILLRIEMAIEQSSFKTDKLPLLLHSGGMNSKRNIPNASATLSLLLYVADT